jgi:photosystem II stability/assembly factor-like uncharacterized protein
MNYIWSPTSAPLQTRYDDIWFISPLVGWAVNSAGQIVHTEDGGKTPWTIQQTVDADTWLRCMSFSSPTDGWVGTITRRQRLWKTQDGKRWTDMTPMLPTQPSAICGISSPSKNVVYASGTQYPAREAAIMHTADGGLTWHSISMAAHANLLIDTYFTDDTHGWVVGGQGGTTYDRLKPVILFTADGGQNWEDRLQNSGINFPRGEWGWKIQFLNSQIGFVSLENDSAAAILKTVDGGQTWKRIEVADPQRNVELEGIGFINEMVGWVGGWGHGFPSNPLGTTSGTTDGGATWSDANNVGRFINRFRFTGSEPIVGYASGGTVYQCVATEGKVPAPLSLAARRAAETPIPFAWESLKIEAQLPDNTKQLTITIFDPRQTLVKVLAEERSPAAGARTFQWDFKTEDGRDAGTGHFMYRISIDGNATTGMVVRPGRTSPEDLGAQVVTMIQRYAPLARRSHDELVLPGADGNPVALKSLFNTPRELMAALVRGGWIIPGAPDRSMFLVAIIGTGPMQSELAKADVDLLSEWITAGAVVPSAQS